MKKQLILSLFMALCIGASAQSNAKAKHSYHITIVENENGKEKVIDRTFANRGEMEAFMKANNIDAPEPPAAPETPAEPDPLTPPSPPAPPALPQRIEKHIEVKEQCKKVVIIERSEKDSKGKTEIITEDIIGDADWIEKELEDADEIKVIVIKKGPKATAKTVEIEETINEKGPKKVVVEKASNNDTPDNVRDIKLYPNPNKGEFTILFNVEKPANVKLRITDLDGKEVYSETLNNFSGRFDKKIEKDNLAKGTYIVDIESAGQKQSIRVAVQ